MIYLDNAATTLPKPEVIDAITQTLRSHSGNASSLHKLGRAAKELLFDCRKTIAHALGAAAETLCFTSGGTESNNWAIHGALHAMRHRGRHIISTAIEHDAVLAPLKDLGTRGYEVTLLQADREGGVSLQALEEALRPDTVLVSAMLVNNETGAVLPIAQMAEIIRRHSPALFHTDAVQGFCKIPFSTSDLGVDLLSVSAHKLHGPPGVGALWIRPGVKLPPLLRGGGQEGNLRSGTEALHNIAGFAKAVELTQESLAETMAHFQVLGSYLRDNLPRQIPSVCFLPQGAPHIVSLSLPHTQSEVIMNYLDSRGIFLSHASACKRGGQSHVLSAMGLPKPIIDGTLRVSFSRHTTLRDMEQLIACLAEGKEMLFPAL